MEENTRNISIDEALRMQEDFNYDCFVAPFKEQDATRPKDKALSALYKTRSELEQIAWGLAGHMPIEKAQDMIARLLSYLDNEIEHIEKIQ